MCLKTTPRRVQELHLNFEFSILDIRDRQTLGNPKNTLTGGVIQMNNTRFVERRICTCWHSWHSFRHNGDNENIPCISGKAEHGSCTRKDLFSAYLDPSHSPNFHWLWFVNYIIPYTGHKSNILFMRKIHPPPIEDRGFFLIYMESNK